MKTEIILIGGGGHCKSCIDVVELTENYRIAGIIDLPEKVGEKVLGYPIIASDADFSEILKQYSSFLITIGQIESPQKRISLFKRLRQAKRHLPVIVSPLAYVSKHARIGDGTVVMHSAVINADAVVGENCIINSKALVEHDAVIGDHCHIATSAIVNGNVLIDEGCFVGSGAVCRNNIKIGAFSFICSNVTVANDVRAFSRKEPEYGSELF